ncbi:YceI family protein [Massilia sp. Root418]|uniref:YceI family protein n=1 Tax=Massilia sp. Root418 TaxID=1736532 RepID=UPI0009E8C9E8|nr:YceI family protein [Massilia sp. Root418]
MTTQKNKHTTRELSKYHLYFARPAWPAAAFALAACAPIASAPPQAQPAARAAAPAVAKPPASRPSQAQPAATPAPASAPGSQAEGAPLKIDSGASRIVAVVRRGGLFARLGHDHVVASRHIEGQASAPAQGKPGSTRFRFRLDQMTVDESALRAEAGMESTPAADAIAGTRNNMLTKVLDADKYPYVEVAAVTTPQGPLQADITLHGVTRRYAIPAVLTARPDGISASGTLMLKQSDFGIKPFAVMGGALAVQDELELRFAISAKR